MGMGLNVLGLAILSKSKLIQKIQDNSIEAKSPSSVHVEVDEIQETNEKDILTTNAAQVLPSSPTTQTALLSHELELDFDKQDAVSAGGDAAGQRS